MLVNAPARHLGQTVSLLSVALLYGCTDAPNPVGPHVTATPHALVAAVNVTNTDDAGAGSLRQAILDAENGATIQFDPSIAGQTIVLSTGSLRIDKTLTIEGALPDGMTISGGLSSGVFFVSTAGDVVLRNLSIVNGREKFGGGLIVEGRATVDHSLVADNEADEVSAGGIYVDDDGDLSVVNSTISGNTSPSTGGGIFAAGTLSIRNSTITNNAAGAPGGGVVVTGKASVRNSIIANNTAPSEANCQIDAGADVVFLGRNVSDDASCGGTGPAMIVGNPQLDPLAFNGGPTRTYALRVASPAIDAGSACSEATDQRYVTRDQGSSCDAGAFEFDAFRSITLTVNPNVAFNAKTGVATVAGTISCDGPAPTPIRVVLSQTQKTKGRFTTIVQGIFAIPFTCVSTPTSWSMPITPTTGTFESGAATGTISTLSVPPGYVPAVVTASLKLFNSK